MNRGLVAALLLAVGIAALGLAAIRATTDARVEARQAEAADELRSLTATMQERINALLLTAPGTGPPAATAGSEPTSFHWRHDGIRLRVSPQPGAEYDAMRAYLAGLEVDAPRTIAPLTTDNGTDVAVFVLPAERGWVGASIPVVNLIGAWKPAVADAASLQLEWSQNGDGPIFRASASTRDNAFAVPVVVPGGRWTLSSGADLIERNPAWLSGLAIIVLVLAGTAGTFAYRSWNRHAPLERDIAHLETRIARLSEELSNEIAHHSDVESELRRMVQVESVTGLPLKKALLSELDRTLARERRSPEDGLALVAVNFLRLDEIQATLGQAFANRVVTEGARRVGEVLDADVYRTADAQIAFMLPGSSPRAAEAKTADVMAALGPEFSDERQSVHIPTVAGIALCDDGYLRASEMLDHCNSALREAQRRDDGWFVYAPESRDDHVSLLQLETDLRSAAERDEFRLVYQPIVSTREGRPSGFECLLRWQHPREGLLGPGAFVPLAESLEIVPRLTRWVLRHAIQQARAWMPIVPDEFYLSINVSAEDLTPEFVQTVREELERTDVPPSRLRLEVLETSLINDMAGTRAVLASLDACGVQIVLDDFGTGLSSLNYMRSLPLSVVKIDKTFIDNLAESSRDFGVVKSVIDLVHFLGMVCVAEGIEYEEQRQLLEVMNCDYCQGYLFAKPLTPVEAEEYLLNGSADALTGTG